MPPIGRRPSALGRRRRSEASNPGKEPNIVVRQTGLRLKCPSALFSCHGTPFDFNEPSRPKSHATTMRPAMTATRTKR